MGNGAAPATDMAAAIVPKSDQLNADDLIAGPRTITVREVKVTPGKEQPVSISFEGDDGKPYKPCKSMARVLVQCWGPDAKQYAGRSMTLYRDPTVKWAGMEVGGIRISHLSGISSDMTFALTASKGSRKPYTVKVLRDAPAGKNADVPDLRKAEDIAEINGLCSKLNAAGDSIKWSGKTLCEYAGEMFAKTLTSLNDLSAEQVTSLLADLNERLTNLDSDKAERGAIEDE